jgi:SAM-dependent methyltransferase
MDLSPDDLDRLAHISTRTLSHYDEQAEAFWQGTRGHDVSQNLAALLRFIDAPAPFDLLDLGCGPGRDLQAFVRLGHRPIGLDGSPCLADMARAFSGCEVWTQRFERLQLPPARFDGVFANASLFHVPSSLLPRVLSQLHDTLKPGGVLLSSNPRGDGREGWQGDRYGVFHDLDGWRRHMVRAGFVELMHYYRPEGLPLAQQPWLATVWRKPVPESS